MEPTAGRIVHYVSHGSPVRADGSQAYASECRAAVVTEVPGGVTGVRTIGLCVLNPTGLFFNRSVPLDESPQPQGGTWHWPERAA